MSANPPHRPRAPSVAGWGVDWPIRRADPGRRGDRAAVAAIGVGGSLAVSDLHDLDATRGTAAS